MFLNELYDDIFRPRCLMDQHFGIGLSPHDIDHPTSTLLRMPFSQGYLRRWRHLRERDSGVSSISQTSNEMKINLDVQQFQPEELNVKIVDNFVLIEGRHGEREDEHGFVSRQFTRRYKLPDNVDSCAVSSSLSSDGVLTVTVPKRSFQLTPSERVVPIVQSKYPVAAEGKRMQTLVEDASE